MIKNKKKKAYKYGLIAEFVSVLYLIFFGYSILSRRYRTKLGEIDIIAKRGNVLAAIEVKARKDNSTEVLSQKQKGRILDAMALFIAKYPKFANFHIRMDLIIIRPWHLPQHIKNAWLGK